MKNRVGRKAVTPSSAPKRAIAYARVSMAREETISPDIQLDAINRWAENRNRIIVGEPISEEGVSGTTFKRRIMEAIERIERNEADEILVWKFSRFGRNTLEFAVNLDRVEKAGGRLVSVTEDVDADTATGQFTRDMLIALAAMESKRISEGWKETQAIRYALGLPHTATPRFGYRHHKCGITDMSKSGWRIRHAKDPECRPDEDGKCREAYRVDPVTGPVLADLYRRYISNEGLASLAAWCNETAQPRDRGGKWYPSTVANVLDSGFGAGLLRVGVRGTKGRPDKDEAIEYLPGSHDAVIKPKVWKAYLARRTALVGTSSSLKRSSWPLTGLIKCGLCEGTMTCAGSARGPGYIYRCTAMQNLSSCPGVWRTRSAIEEALFAELAWVADELATRARATAPTVRRQQVLARGKRATTERELAEVKAGKRRLVEQVVRGTLTDEDIAEAMTELNAKTARLTDDLLAAATPPKAVNPVVIRSMAEDWPTLPVEAARAMARLLVKDIVCHRDKTITVTLADVLRG